jgi:hypothetical protein
MEDHWRVANWEYENSRTIAYLGSVCIMEAASVPGLSRDYTFGGETMGDFIVTMPTEDAEALLAASPLNFTDVTDADDPEAVAHEPIIVRRDPATGKYYKSIKR